MLKKTTWKCLSVNNFHMFMDNDINFTVISVLNIWDVLQKTGLLVLKKTW